MSFTTLLGHLVPTMRSMQTRTNTTHSPPATRLNPTQPPTLSYSLQLTHICNRTCWVSKCWGIVFTTAAQIGERPEGIPTNTPSLPKSVVGYGLGRSSQCTPHYFYREKGWRLGHKLYTAALQEDTADLPPGEQLKDN